MKKHITVLLLSVTSICRAQDTVLTAYLAQHRYAIDLNDPGAFHMLPDMMKGKNLFVLGEGGSHGLELYAPLKSAVLDQLATQNLKYFFIELGRSTAYILNNYLDKQTDSCTSAFTKYCRIMDHEKATIKKGHDFKLVGIDFEIRIDFNTALNQMFGNVDLGKCPTSKAFLADLLDSTCLKMTHKAFMKFYKAKREEFQQNKIAIKLELGDKYNGLEYLVTNQNTTRPNIDRNPAMSKNLLQEINPLDTSGVYFLTIGMAHSMPCDNFSVVHKLCKSDVLKDRVLVMNLHCENCSLNGAPLTGKTMLRFMNDQDIEACFSKAAIGAYTLFDLSQLPDEYSDIKKYGDLLLMAKGQH